MGDSIIDTEGAAKEVASRLGNPVYVMGFLLVAVMGFLFYGIVVYGGPILDAQLEGVKASTEAIKSNADMNKQTAKAVIKIQELQEEQISSMKSVIKSQNGIAETCAQGFEQSLKDHKQIMAGIQKKIDGQ